MKSSWVNFKEESFFLNGEETKVEPFDNNIVFFDAEDQGDYEWLFDHCLLEDIETPDKNHFFMFDSGKTECVETGESLEFFIYRHISEEANLILILKNEQDQYTILKNL